LGHTAEVPKSVLETANELLGGLAQDRFAIGFSRKAQDDAEDPAAATLPGQIDQGSPDTKIHLGLFAGLTFDAVDAVWIGLFEGADEAFNRLVRTGKGEFQFEILVNTLSAETPIKSFGNQRTVFHAKANTPTFPGGRNGWFCRQDLRAGGRNGRF